MNLVVGMTADDSGDHVNALASDAAHKFEPGIFVSLSGSYRTFILFHIEIAFY